MPSERGLPHAALWIVLLAAVAFPFAAALRDDRAPAREAASEALADLGAVPDFELIESRGGPLRSADLRGRPWIAGFVFTRCEGPCPTIAARMAALSRRLAGSDARLVAFSVDPEHDRPDVLDAFARRFDGDRERWLLATGEVEAMRRLVRDGFHLAMTESAGGMGHGGPITHSTRVALVDREGRIRRYYGGTEPGWGDQVLRDLAALEPR